MSICVSDWMRLNCGDVVREIEGRHTGRVERITSSSEVLVRWHETGWYSVLRLYELERVKGE